MRGRARAGLCPACGQPLPPSLRWCWCGHPEAGHDLNRKGERSRCFHIDGPEGAACGCKRFTERPPTE